MSTMHPITQQVGEEGERLRMRFSIDLRASWRLQVRAALQALDVEGSGLITLDRFLLASQEPPLRDRSVVPFYS